MGIRRLDEDEVSAAEAAGIRRLRSGAPDPPTASMGSAPGRRDYVYTGPDISQEGFSGRSFDLKSGTPVKRSLLQPGDAGAHSMGAPGSTNVTAPAPGRIFKRHMFTVPAEHLVERPTVGNAGRADRRRAAVESLPDHLQDVFNDRRS